MLFPADLAPRPLPRIPYPQAVEITRDVPNSGPVKAWLIAPGMKPDTHARPLAIFFHGNAELIDYQDDMISGYHQLGCTVLLPEYRGYGRSQGKPSQQAIVDDAVWFHDLVTKRTDIDSSRVVIHGRSLGGAVASQLADQRLPRALILQSTFISVTHMARGYLVPAFLVKNPFRTDQILPKLDIPVLIMHGDCDDIIPLSHAKQLQSLARRPTYVEFSCMHNDFPGLGMEEKYWTAISQFLRSVDMIPPSSR